MHPAYLQSLLRAGEEAWLAISLRAAQPVISQRAVAVALQDNPVGQQAEAIRIRAKHSGILAKLIFLVRLPVPQQERFLDRATRDLGEAGLANPSLHDYLLGGFLHSSY